MNKINNKIISSIIRYILAALFFYTVYYKLKDIESFELSLIKSSLILSSQVVFVKYGLIISEMAVIIILLFEKFLFGLYMSFFLLLTFTVYLIALNNFSVYDGCSCGGVFNQMSYSGHLITNFSFIIVNIIAILIYNNPISIK